MFIFVLLFFVILIFILKYFIERYIFLQKLSHIKGPKGVLFFGNGLDFIKSTDLLNSIYKYYKECGPVFKVFLGPLYTHIYIIDPEMVEQVLHSKKLIKKSMEYTFAHKWLGSGLITASEQTWKVHRKLMTPAFHFKVLETFKDQLNKPYKVLEKKIYETNGKSVDVYDFLSLYTLDIVSETSMGYEINAQIEKHSPIVQSTKELSRIISSRAFSVFNRFEMFYKFSKDWKLESDHCNVIHSTTDGVIAKRKQNFIRESKHENGEFEIKARRAFLDIFLEYQQEFGVSDKELRYEVNTIMFAGQDTTASGLTFTLYCLSRNPSVQKKLYEEVMNLFELKAGDKITFGDLNNCKYLDMVIKEALRLFPPVPVIGREVTEDFKLCDMFLPKGVTLGITPYVTHRNPKYFKNPDIFDPEHFNEENTKNRHPYCYIPFSAGPRNCIGQKFAMQTMKNTIANIIRSFEIEPDDEHELILCSEITLKPTNGCYLKFKKR